MMERRAIIVEGLVQGVGFRPFIYGLASRFDLGGFVKNRRGIVAIEVEGDGSTLDRFLSELARQAPPLARIDRISQSTRPPQGDRTFHIEASDAEGTAEIFISPDVATCADCLAEMFNPADRRHLYPFLNCTNCGPRLTIVTGSPYDRPRTTMAGFPMCLACRAEYDDPHNRRFHAQPTCCPVCGPRLQTFDGDGRPIETDDPLAYFIDAIRAGKIGALKGVGGYHLVCDAQSEEVVRELRRRKHRDEKPFAVMMRDLSAIQFACVVEAAEKDLLLCARRPIVLLRKRAIASVAKAVAPRNPYLGVMLPYSPLHHLLLRGFGDAPLVMTSGNSSDEPIAYHEADAFRCLNGIADIFLTHNRSIHVRCDDSVTRVIDNREAPLRRSRGYAPLPLRLPVECPCPILALGGQLKATFALGRRRHAFLSHHLGDLDNYDAFQAFGRDIRLYQQMFAMNPELIVHDLHPDYATTHFAHELAGRSPTSVRLAAVQHHHAHMAACMAENGLREPVIGVSFDGTGYGTDGAIWGGEFLVGDYAQFRRAAHLRYVALPGGDRAVREPWRTALSHLLDAGADPARLERRIEPYALRTIRKMLDKKVNTPITSSMGRLFDAVAALAGVRDVASYEAQAALELEWLAASVAPDSCYPFELVDSAPDQEPMQVDTRPLIRAVWRDAEVGADAGQIGRRFHSTLVEIIVAVCNRLRQLTQIDAVTLSGGVFMNALLTVETDRRLRRAGFRVFRHQLTPPSDGSLSLGQLAVAASRVNDVKFRGA
jgi:hydrogenase maturation protein HypF